MLRLCSLLSNDFSRKENANHLRFQSNFVLFFPGESMDSQQQLLRHTTVFFHSLLGCDYSFHQRCRPQINTSKVHPSLVLSDTMSVSYSLLAQWTRSGRCAGSRTGDPTLTHSSSKGPPQGPDPSRRALTRARATDLRALRGIPWPCRTEHLALWAACSTASRSVIVHLHPPHF